MKALQPKRSAILSLVLALVLSSLVIGPNRAAAAFGLVQDDFSYTPGTYLNTTSAAGGWSTGWKADIGLTTALDSSYVTTSNHNIEHNTNIAMYRGLTTPINLGIDQNYYVSWTMRADNPVAANAAAHSGLSLSSNTFFGMTAKDPTSGNLIFSAKFLNNVVNGPDVVKGQRYTVVLKIAAKASAADNAYLKIYAPGSLINEEPGTGGWDIAVSATDSTVFGALGFKGDFMAAGKHTFDDLKAGSRWSDVTSAPSFYAQDDFDYASGTKLNTTTLDGGWSSGWKANAALTSALDNSVVASASGGGVQKNTSLTLYRGTNAPIDLTANIDYYIRWQVKVDDPVLSNTAVYARLFLDSTNFFGIANKGDGTTNMRLTARFQGTNAYGADIVKGQTYTMVVKISAKASGNDTAYMKMYGPSDVIGLEPTAWDITISKAGTSVFSVLGWQANLLANGTALFDNIQAGTSWYDITGNLKFEGQEWFDYAAGTKLNTTQANGLFSTGWRADYALNTTLGDNYAVSSNQDIQLTTSTSMYRGLRMPIDLNQNRTYYFSWQMRVDNPVTANLSSRSRLYLSSNTFFGMAAKDATSGDLQFRARFLGTDANGPDVVKGQTYTVVVKIVAQQTGSDQAFMKVYNQGESAGLEPTTWDITVSAGSTTSFSTIGFEGNLYAAGKLAFDQLNIGTTWNDANQSEARKLGEALFSKIDLTRSELSAVNALVSSQNYEGALTAYRDFFIDHISTLSLGAPVCMSSCGTTLLDVMADKATVNNQPVGTTTNSLGVPGSIDWYFVSSDGNPEFSVFVSHMNYTYPLPTAFVSTGDPMYMQKWNAIWDDFATNNYDEWFGIFYSPEKVNYPTLNNAWLSRLYLGFRSDAFFQQLNKAATANPTLTKMSIDPFTLGKILNLWVDKLLNPLVTITASGGVPNQNLHAGVSLVRASLALDHYKDKDTWYNQGKWLAEKAIDPVNGTMMKDGSDLEQSFNYNSSLLDFAEQLRAMYPGSSAPQWVIDYPIIAAKRLTFMASLLRPTGNMSALDKMDDRNAYYDWKFPAMQAYYNDETTARILNNLFLSNTSVQPLFTSIYFPYGGFTSMRSGWDPNAYHLFMNTARRGSGHLDESINQIQVTAFGKTMLIDSGPSSYSVSAEEQAPNDYLIYTLSHNTVSVDHLTQMRYKEPAVYNAYTTPINARWSTSSKFDFVEGNYSSGYGAGYQQTSPSVLDVTHDRQSLYVKDLGVFVITDRMNSANSHDYTQLWNFDPSYGVTDVVYGSDMIKTTAATGPNIELYNFSTHALTYTGHGGLYRSKSSNPVVTKRDVHVDWSGTGNQLLVTLINPINGTTTDIQSINRIANDAFGTIEGFDAAKTNGMQVQYRAALNKNAALTIGNMTLTGEALLVTTDSLGNRRGIALGATALTINGVAQSLSYDDFEFTLSGNTLQSATEIKVPTDFEWYDTGNGLTPVYQ